MPGWLLLLLCGLLLGGCREEGGFEPPSEEGRTVRISYPDTYRDTLQVDTYHGKKIADPYHWLEYENNPSVQQWIGDQRQLTDDYMEQLPEHAVLRQRLRQLWNYERYAAPVQRGAYYYHLKNDGLQDQAVLYRSRGLYGSLDTVFNPNELAIGQIQDYSFSPNGRWAAVQYTEAGSDWQQVRVVDLRRGRLQEDELDGLKYSNLAWYGEGFFYSRYPKPQGWELRALNEFHQLYYHRLGTDQEADELIFADRNHPLRNVYGETTADERFLIISLQEGPSGNAVYFRDLRSRELDFTPIYSDQAYNFRLVGSRG